MELEDNIQILKGACGGLRTAADYFFERQVGLSMMTSGRLRICHVFLLHWMLRQKSLVAILRRPHAPLRTWIFSSGSDISTSRFFKAGWRFRPFLFGIACNKEYSLHYKLHENFFVMLMCSPTAHLSVPWATRNG